MFKVTDYVFDKTTEESNRVDLNLPAEAGWLVSTRFPQPLSLN